MTKNKQLVLDVRDLLNLLAIKLSDVKPYEGRWDEDGHPIYNEDANQLDDQDETTDLLDQEELFLACLKNVVTRALNDKDGTSLERNELKYYTSTCF